MGTVSKLLDFCNSKRDRAIEDYERLLVRAETLEKQGLVEHALEVVRLTKKHRKLIQKYRMHSMRLSREERKTRPVHEEGDETGQSDHSVDTSSNQDL